MAQTPEGILIQHTPPAGTPATIGTRVHVVHVMKRPYATPIDCPTCHVVHPVKAVHLWLNADGQCLVSKGVLEDLKLAGLAAENIRVVGTMKNPPPVQIGKDVDRFKVDQDNAKITIHKGA